MTGEDLQSIGITAFGIRHRLLRRIKELLQEDNEGTVVNFCFTFYRLI